MQNREKHHEQRGKRPQPNVSPQIAEKFPKILQVDDDQYFLNLSKQILESQGKFEVETALSVDEAFKKLEQKQYDVVVSDYEMPQKNGIQFLEELKKTENSLPFILFTGRGREEVAVKALNLGAFRYVNKHGDTEVVFTELLSCIRQAVNHARAESLLKQSEERFRAIFESTNDAIIVINDKGIITNLNQAALQMFRCTREVVGECFFARFSQLFPQASKEAVLGGIKKFSFDTQGQITGKTIKLPMFYDNGEKRIIEMHASVFKQDNQLYSLAIIRDITDRSEKRKTNESEQGTPV